MRFITCMAIVLFAAVFLENSRLVGGQAPAAKADRPPRSAIANPFRIMSQSQETKDWQAEQGRQNLALQAEFEKRRGLIQQRIAGLQQIKPDNQKFLSESDEIERAQADLEVFQRSAKRKAEYEEKMWLKAMYDKIAAAVGEVAKRDGIDYVLTDSRAELTADKIVRMEMKDLNSWLSAQTVIYSNSAADITDRALLALDTQYAKSKQGTPAAPAR